MCGFNGTLKLWIKAGKNVLLQCANIISSSIIGQAVSRFLTWINKFILEQVLERIKSFVFNNSFLRPAFTTLNELMRSLMEFIVDSGGSADEASQKIRRVLNQAKEKLTAGDWLTELRTNSASITSRMMRIFHDSTAGLTSLQSSFVGEYQDHASAGNTQGITAATNAGTIEKAISMGKTIFDYGQKATEVTYKIGELVTASALVMKLATHSSTYVGDLNAALQDELRALKMKNQQQGQHRSAGQNVGALSEEEKKRFKEFAAEIEGEIQSSIMKTTLDTIQQAWLQPMIQLKVERTVSKIGSKLVQKYCPSLLPEGFGKSRDQYDSKNIADNEKIPSDNQWIDEMGNGKLAGPIEMQNSVDACGFVLQLEDKTGQYTQVTEGNNFTYYPEGNPYSDKPVIKMSFTQNEDGSQHVRLIMPNGKTQEYVSDPSEPPGRCFFGALSMAQNDPTVDHTINKLKNHAKGNDRARFMSKLGVDRHYQHLQGGAYRIERHGDKTRIEYDRLGRPVRIITMETDRKHQRNPKKKEKIKSLLGFQEGDEYGHIISLNSGGVNENWNISRMTHECNQIFYREHEKNFEKFRDKIGSQEVITRVISIHYEYKVEDMMAMSKSDRENKNLLFKASSYYHDFYTGPRENPTNMYLSGSIPNWKSKGAANAPNESLRTSAHRNFY
jgi:hypothetical protein